MDVAKGRYQGGISLTVSKTTYEPWDAAQMSPTVRWRLGPDSGILAAMTASSAAIALPDVQRTPGGPFGIYVHVPFCITRCGYCDFNTYTPAELGGVNPDAWLAALRTELELAAERLDGPTVSTVFVGGGTPSLLGGQRLATLLDMVREHFTLAPDAEVSTEANPESTWPEFFAAIRTAGYTRV